MADFELRIGEVGKQGKVFGLQPVPKEETQQAILSALGGIISQSAEAGFSVQCPGTDSEYAEVYVGNEQLKKAKDIPAQIAGILTRESYTVNIDTQARSVGFEHKLFLPGDLEEAA